MLLLAMGGVIYSLSCKIVLHSLLSLIMLAKHLKERVHIIVLIAQNVCMCGLPSKAENVRSVKGGYHLYQEHKTPSLFVVISAEVPRYCCVLMVLPCISLNCSTLPSFHVPVDLNAHISPKCTALQVTGSSSSKVSEAGLIV